MQREATEDFLAIRVAGEPFALRLSETARISRAPRVVAVPSASASVIGVAAMRGTLLSVHCLARLLGYSGGTHEWIAIARDTDVALAFEAVDAFVRVPRGSTGALRSGEVVRPLVDLIAVMQSVKRSD
jgi:purine-binding chemotaxis protein CheW